MIYLMKIELPNIYSYTNYRQYLADFYAAKKKGRSRFSLRLFSQQAGLGSSNLLKLVIDGARNLTEETASKFAKALNLNKSETDFFFNLVSYNQARDLEAKNTFYLKMLRNEAFRQLRPLERAQLEYFRHWYYPVLRELLSSKRGPVSPEALAKRLRPRVSVSEVENALEVLRTLGFIRSVGKRWIPTGNLLTTGDEVRSLTLMAYHKQILRMWADTLEDCPADQRDISALTLGIKKNLVPKIKARVQEFRHEILKMVADQDDPETVVVLSMQLMPVTTNSNEDI